MDIDFLRTFLEVSKTRHFGKAARNIFVTQSTVSSRIKLLEESLGTKLFERTRNDIKLTQAGEKLVQQAEVIVGLWDDTKTSIVEGDEERPTLFVSSVSSLWDMLLLDWLKLLRSKLPNLNFRGESLGVEPQIRGLLGRTQDVGFMFEPPQVPELVFKEIATIDLILASTREGLSTLEALSYDYIMVEWGTSFHIEHNRAFPDIKTPMIHLNLGRWAVDFLLQVGGSAYLAKDMIVDLLEGKQLFEVAESPVFSRKAYAVYNKKSKNIECIEHCLGYLSSSRES